MQIKSIYTFKDNEQILESKTMLEILHDYQPFINKVVKQIHSSLGNYCSIDDLKQNASLEMIYAYNRYDYNYGVSFNFYIKNILFRTLYNKTMIEIQKIQKLCLGYDDDFSAIEYGIIQESANKSMDSTVDLLDFNEFVDSCSNQEQLILKYRSEGLTQTEISEKLLISQSKISRILNKIKNEFITTVLNEVK